MRKVLLYGKMRQKFGKFYMLDVNTPTEAIHALMCVVDGFRSWFLKEAREGAQYHIFCGRRNIGQETLALPAKEEEAIRIVPVVNAAKGGILMTVAGVGLIAAGVIFQNPYAMAAGFGLVVGGVMAMKVPPKTPTMEREDSRPSFTFDGAVNTEAAGHPYPILYGKILCGSAVASAGLYTAEYPIA